MLILYTLDKLYLASGGKVTILCHLLNVSTVFVLQLYDLYLGATLATPAADQSQEKYSLRFVLTVVESADY